MPTMTLLVDGTIPVAEDFNGNFRRLNQALGTSTAITNIAQGDLLYGSTTDTLSRRAIGASGEVLTVVGGVPTWALGGGGGGGAPFTFTPLNATFPAANFPQILKNVGTNAVDYTLDFDQTTGESAMWQVALPATASFSGITIEVYSRQASLIAGTAGWIVETRLVGESVAWDVAGDTTVIPAAVVKGTAGQILRQEKALAVSGAAASTVLQMRLTRDVVNDTVAEDVKFMVAVLRLT